MLKKFVVAVDFDGTIVANEVPNIGRDLGGLFWMSQLKELWCELVLWTCREDELLDQAKEWLDAHGYGDMFDAVNEQAPSVGFPSRKVAANAYAGDRAVGAPIKRYVDKRLPDHYDWNRAGPILVKAAAEYKKRQEKEGKS